MQLGEMITHYHRDHLKPRGLCCGKNALLFDIMGGRVETESGGTRKRTGGEVKGKKANGGGSQQPCPVSDTDYPALLSPMRILRLPAAD